MRDFKGATPQLDLLFVVDTSPGMAPHIARLRAAVPRLYETLTAPTRKQRDAGHEGLTTYTGVHMGVVSADLGGTGAAALGCSAHGDNGLLRAAPDCGIAAGSFSAFAHGSLDNDAALAALDCQLAALGSECQVSQPLEAAVEAVWPPPSLRGVEVEPLEFPNGASGHGDQENRGFVHEPEREGASTLLMVFVTNQDDDSALGADQLRSIERYMRALHGPHWAEVGSVILGGVPTDVKLALEREEADDYYLALLQDPRMQLQASPKGGFEPVCTIGDAAAYPARRMVELAKGVGYRGVVIGSICAEDLTAPIYAWWLRREQVFSSRLDVAEFCAPLSRFARTASGLFPCRMSWELPKTSGPLWPQTPTACSERPEWLSKPDAASPQVGPNGGALCDVHQVPVLDPERDPEPEAGEGFFVDMSASAARSCSEPRVLTFTQAARLPDGVRVSLRCSRELYYGSGSDAHPTLGDPCDYVHVEGRASGVEGDERCQLPVESEADGRYRDKGTLFCHPDSHVCAMSCQTHADCPTDWLCEAADSPANAGAGRAACVNPSCQ